MKKGFYSIMAMFGALINGSVSPYHKTGKTQFDDSKEAKKARVKRYRLNQSKPYKGMKWFEKYGVWAINEKNAKRKSANHGTH